MGEHPQRRYFLAIKFGGATRLIDRVRESVPQIKEILHSLTNGEYQLAYSSDDGGCFGFVMSSRVNANQIKARLESPSRDGRGEGSPLIREDSLLVMELGEDFSENGFGRAAGWLQHHKER